MLTASRKPSRRVKDEHITWPNLSKFAHARSVRKVLYFNVKYSVYFFTIRKWIRRISKGYAWWLSGYERDSGVVGSDFVSPLSWCDTCLQDRPLVVFSGYPQFPLRCVCVFPHRHRVQRCHVATPTTAHTPDDTVIQHTVVLAGEEHHPDVTSSFWLRCFGVPGILFSIENGLLAKLLPLRGSQSPGYLVLWVWHRQSLWLVVYIWLFYPKGPAPLPSLCPPG